MNRTATWKSLTVGAALAGFAFFGAATAQAQLPPPPAGVTGSTEDCTGGGASASRCTTNGSNAITTSPRTFAQPRIYGPHISQDKVWLVAD